MRISSTYGTSTPQPVTRPAPPAVTTPVAPSSPTPRTFSVLNDFRYLTDSDKELLREVTGDIIDPALMDGRSRASAFAQQLALDRRTGELAPNQQVTGVYLQNAAATLEANNAGRQGFRNPYSGEVFDNALSWLSAHGRSRADIRL